MNVSRFRWLTHKRRPRKITYRRLLLGLPMWLFLMVAVRLVRGKPKKGQARGIGHFMSSRFTPPAWMASLTLDYAVMGLTLAAYAYMMNKLAERSE